jgi:microcin C transport system ATP-binding protein
MSEPLLKIEDLRVDFRSSGRVVHAVRGVDLALRKGETLALVGESGSGKSVTAHAIMRLLPYPDASHPSGSIRVKGVDTLKADAETLRQIRGNTVGMVFQEPMSALNPLHTVARQIREVLLQHNAMGVTAANANQRVRELLELVGIDAAAKRMAAYPHELSGGQRQRVMIAMALANEPELLIADEPTTALDVTVQAQILDLLKDLQTRFQMAVLLITHDFGVVRQVADRVAVMFRGEIVERNTTAEIFDAPEHAYTRKLMDAEPRGAPAPLSETDEEMVATQDLRVWFPIKKGFLRRTVDNVKAVDGITLTIRKGAALGVVGESGSGKSTLGLAILRLIHSQGRILFEGQAIDGYSKAQMRPLRRVLQVVFQDPFGSLSPRMSIAGIIGEGLAVHAPGDDAGRDKAIVAALTAVGLDPEARHRYPHEFSGGQRQRIAIARALALRPDLLILDEPTSSLDRSVQFQVLTLLKEIQTRFGLTYLFISHDLKVVKSLCHDIIVMRRGRVVEAGSAASVFSAPQHPYTQALLAAAMR